SPSSETRHHRLSPPQSWGLTPPGCGLEHKVVQWFVLCHQRCQARPTTSDEAAVAHAEIDAPGSIRQGRRSSPPPLFQKLEPEIQAFREHTKSARVRSTRDLGGSAQSPVRPDCQPSDGHWAKGGSLLLELTLERIDLVGQ